MTVPIPVADVIKLLRNYVAIGVTSVKIIRKYAASGVNDPKEFYSVGNSIFSKRFYSIKVLPSVIMS